MSTHHEPMPFLAYGDGTDALVVPEEVTDSETVHCPDCGGQMRPRGAGDQQARHFMHVDNLGDNTESQICAGLVRDGVGESDRHRILKSLAVSGLRTRFADFDVSNFDLEPVETGALRGLRQHDVAQNVIELGYRSADHSAALTEESGEETPSQMTLTHVESPDGSDSSDGSTLTVRYELPYRSDPSSLVDTGVEVAQTILQEIDRAVDQTDYTYLSSLPAIDLHAYSDHREVLTIGIDALTVKETDWESLSEQPTKLRKLAVSFHELLRVQK